MTSAGSASGRRLDELAELEEQRRFLLRSIDDLEREHRAGDIDDADYEALHGDYTARAANVLRRIEGGAEDLRELAGKVGGRKPASRARRLISALTVAIIAIGTGVVVARSAGERTEGELLTGGDRVAAMTAEQDAAQRLLASARENLATDRVAAIQDFDSAWKLDNTLVEAPTYAGWLLRLTALAIEDEKQRSEIMAAALRRIELAIAADPNYPDARAFRGIMRLRDLDDKEGAAADFAVLERLDPSPEIRTLVSSAAQEANAE
jgi:tetratricopeptide (TPR) repeat protein